MVESLEQKAKPDWKQLLPILGFFQTKKDIANNKPTFLDRDNPLSNLYPKYQGIIMTIPFGIVMGFVGYKIYKMAEPFFN